MTKTRMLYEDAREDANYAAESIAARLRDELMQTVIYRNLPEDFAQLAQAYAACERLNLDIKREMTAEDESEVFEDE